MRAFGQEARRQDRRYTLKLGTRLVLASLASLFGVSRVQGQGTGTVRVFVEYKPGQKESVKSALLAAGGQIHHEFDDLSTIAVTLPKGALARIKHDPNVLHVEADPSRHLLNEEKPPYVTPETGSLAPRRNK